MNGRRGIVWISLLALLPGVAHAAKYPACAQGKLLGQGTKFELQTDLKQASKSEIAKILYHMGKESVLRPSFPQLTAESMSITMETKANPNEPNEVKDPQELDRMARFELGDLAKIKNVAIYCD